jgi:sigma-B regulation protein RsbU (phosphoserine phosphatase)
MSDAQSALELVRLFSRLVRFVAMYGEEHQQPKQALEALKHALDLEHQGTPKIAIALQGPALVVQGHFQPPQDAAVGTLATVLRTHAVNSLSFLAGVSISELLQIAKVLATKPQEALAGGQVKPDLLRGLDRIHVNDIRFVAVEEHQAVVNAGQVLPFSADTTVIRIPRGARPLGAIGGSDAPAAGTEPGGGAPAEGAAPAAAGGPAPESGMVSVPLSQLVPLLEARAAQGNLAGARALALESLAGHITPGGDPIVEQLARALDQIPEGIRRELVTPDSRAELSAAVLARQLDAAAGSQALPDAIHELAPQLGDAIPLLENLSRLLQKSGRRPSLETLERVMKFLPDVNRLEEVLQGEVVVVDGDAARREAYRQALSEYGYTVEEAGTGADVLKRLAARAGVAAIVTDLNLPDLGVGGLLSKLKRVHPAPPVVIASPKAEAAQYDFDVAAYPRKRLVASHDPAAVTAAVREIAVRPERPEAEADLADRERAREIQQRLVPREIPPAPGWESAFGYKPAGDVGGDYLDAFPLDADRIGFVAGDVSGKGFSAALVMVMVRSAFRLSAPGYSSCRDAVAAVNRLVRGDIKKGMFVSVVYGCLHVPTGKVHVVNCGHNPPVVVDASGAPARMLAGSGMPLGVADPARFDPTLKEEPVELGPGGRVIFYTDGVVEAMNAREQEFGEAAFLDLVTRGAADPPARLVDAVLLALAAHRGAAPQSDDITLLDLRRLPAGG